MENEQTPNRASKVPLEVHEQIGSLLKGIFFIMNNHDLKDRVNEIRGALDALLQREYVELPPERFFNVYYGKSEKDNIEKFDDRLKVQISEVLMSIKSLIEENFPNCVERGEALGALNRSVTLCRT